MNKVTKIVTIVIRKTIYYYLLSDFFNQQLLNYNSDNHILVTYSELIQRPIRSSVHKMWVGPYIILYTIILLLYSIYALF